MALIVLTFQDQPDGTVDIKMNLEPPVPEGEVIRQTIAQQLSAVALNAVHASMVDLKSGMVIVGADGMKH